MISKRELLDKYVIPEDYFEAADISWEDLSRIYEDFSYKREHVYLPILTEFHNKYLADLGKAGLHSIRTRVKDPEHLIVKIIRRRNDNYKKYKNLTPDNYELFLTDLIGIRGFILFKEDWKDFHKYITDCFPNDPNLYVKDCLRDVCPNPDFNYHIEAPKVHVRNGDNKKIYEGFDSTIQINSNKVYRSLHYIIRYRGIYIEIQVRTLFEEGWGEIDHNLVYPYYKEDPVLKEYTEMLNRLTGLADEMGSFFIKVKQLERYKLLADGTQFINNEPAPQYVIEDHKKEAMKEAGLSSSKTTPSSVASADESSSASSHLTNPDRKFSTGTNTNTNTNTNPSTYTNTDTGRQTEQKTAMSFSDYMFKKMHE